jgi:hypothetical protein
MLKTFLSVFLKILFGAVPYPELSEKSDPDPEIIFSALTLISKEKKAEEEKQIHTKYVETKFYNVERQNLFKDILTEPSATCKVNC